MLAFNFASRIFAYRRLAEGLSRSSQAISSFMGECLNPVIKADECAQNVDYIGIAANSPQHHICNLQPVFKCNQNAGSKFNKENCCFGTKENVFLSRTITPNGVTQQKRNVPKSLEEVKVPRFKKALQRYLGFLIYYPYSLPRLAERLDPYCQLLTKKQKTKTNQYHTRTNERIPPE